MLTVHDVAGSGSGDGVSHYVDDSYSAYCESFRKARKAHKCDACKCDIPCGGHYCYISYVWDGSAYSVKRCLACQATHEHLRKLGRAKGMWPDEKLNCGIAYEEEWGELPPEIAALAFWKDGDPLPQNNTCDYWNYANWYKPGLQYPLSYWRVSHLSWSSSCYTKANNNPTATERCV